MIEHEKVLESYRYDQETGDLFWNRKSQKNEIGDIAGYFNKHCNCWYVWDLAGKQIPRSRLIWYLMTGNEPSGAVIVHINKNPTDDSWKNLKLKKKKEIE